MKKFLFTTALFCTVGFSVPVSAQSLDYGTMQDMFGEPVTTSANGSPQRVSDVPLDMTIITAEDIARYPATEIPDILRHYAGVSVRQNSSSEYSVGIRGYNTPSNERLLVLVNGRQVFEDYFGLVNWSAIPVELNEIRQIEIIRGPNTALFGFNATSGVVNIVTHNPLYDDTDVVEGDVGINGYAHGSGIYTFQNDNKFGMRLSYGGKTNDDDTNNINPVTRADLRDTAQARTFAVDTALQLNEATQMRIEASRTTVDENILDPFYDGYRRDTDTTSIRINLTSDTDYGIIEATMYKNGVDVDYKNGSNAPGAIFNFNNDVVVTQLSDTFKIGTDHTIRIAGEYRNNQTDHTVNILAGLNGGNPFLGTTILNVQSLSTLWYWNVTDDLSFSAAGRYDHVQSDFDGSIIATTPFTNADANNRYDEFGYNLGLVYKVTDVDTVRLTAAKGIDLPSSFEMGFQGGPSFNADPNIDASDVHDFQLGYERQISSLGGSFKATGFYQRINEHQGFLVTGTTGATGNLGDSEVYGIELGLDGTSEAGIRWGVNYSYARIEDDLRTADTSLSYEDENSDHIINANIGYSPNDQWDYDLFASYQSEFDQQRGPGASTVSNVTLGVNPDVLIDARIAYKPIDKLTLSLNGRGLLGDNEQSAYGEDVDSQMFLRAKYSF